MPLRYIQSFSSLTGHEDNIKLYPDFEVLDYPKKLFTLIFHLQVLTKKVSKFLNKVASWKDHNNKSLQSYFVLFKDFGS
jgi:hypothetical protein